MLGRSLWQVNLGKCRRERPTWSVKKHERDARAHILLTAVHMGLNPPHEFGRSKVSRTVSIPEHEGSNRQEKQHHRIQDPVSGMR